MDLRKSAVKRRFGRETSGPSSRGPRPQIDGETLMPSMASHLYQNPENPNELIDSPWGKIPQWKASTLATGSMGVVTRVIRTKSKD
jgi:hypothetical protein